MASLPLRRPPWLPAWTLFCVRPSGRATSNCLQAVGTRFRPVLLRCYHGTRRLEVTQALYYTVYSTPRSTEYSTLYLGILIEPRSLSLSLHPVIHNVPGQRKRKRPRSAWQQGWGPPLASIYKEERNTETKE